MTPEEKIKLDHIYELTEENNRLLRQIRRGSRWTIAWRIFEIDRYESIL